MTDTVRHEERSQQTPDAQCRETCTACDDGVVWDTVYDSVDGIIDQVPVPCVRCSVAAG